MLKKLVLLIGVILILIAAFVIAPIAVVLPWSITRSDRSTTGVGTSDPTQSAIHTLFPSLVSTVKPANPVTSPTSVKGQLSSPPVCFSTEELIPFAFTPQATNLLVRARSGVQIFNLESGTQDAFIQSSQEICKR